MITKEETIFLKKIKDSKSEIPKELKAKIITLIPEESNVCCKIHMGSGRFEYHKVTSSICKSLAGEEVDNSKC